MSRYKFDDALQMREFDDSHTKFRVHLTDEWSFGNAPNGGFLASLLLSACQNAIRNEIKVRGKMVEYPHPISASLEYLGVCTAPGDIEIHVDILKLGRRFANAYAKLVQKNRVNVTIMCIFGDLSGLESLHNEPSVTATGVDSQYVSQDRLVIGDEKDFDTGGVVKDVPKHHQRNHLYTRSILSLSDMRDMNELGKRHSMYSQMDIHANVSPSGTVSGILGFKDNRPIDLIAAPIFADCLDTASDMQRSIDTNTFEPVSWTATLHLDMQFIKVPPVSDTRVYSLSYDSVTDGELIEIEANLFCSTGEVILRLRQRCLEMSFQDNLQKGKK